MGSNGMESARKAYRKALTKPERITLKDERFLLLKLGNRLSDKERQARDGLLGRHPSLRAAYECKERFYSIWDATTRYDANYRMAEWLSKVTPELQGHFKEAMSALRTRREHILNYFDYPVTNAYTESINRLAKSINRMGRGYSLEVVRAKMLYDPRAIEKGALVERIPDSKPTTTGRGQKPKRDESPTTGFITPEIIAHVAAAAAPRSKKRYYGAHIPTLCDLLDAGEFE